MYLLTIQYQDDTIPLASKRPHRLEAQDGALSRPKLGFESPWGHKKSHFTSDSFYFQTGVPAWGMLFESPWGHK
jgi:hypothetical protein